MEALMMENEMSNWNDDRLDELNGRVKDGFASVDKRFERVEGEIKEGFARVDREMKEGFARAASREELTEFKLASREEMGEVKGQLERLNDRIDRLHYSLVAATVAIFAALLANGVLS